MMTARVLARAPGTWGELVQGTVDGEDVLVTCPVNLYAQAVATALDSSLCWRGPMGRSRTQLALADLPGGGRVRLRSPLRPGAGMASSTADLCAALTAAATAIGTTLTPMELFTWCLRIEPTDGLMFPGIALVDHRRGRRVQLLGAPPPLAILGVDAGGMVRTADFNGRLDLVKANQHKEPGVRAAVALAVHAVAAGDPAALAEAATLSARAHQAILPNPLWEQAMRLAPGCGALGVNVAHSGTVLGFLFDIRRVDLSFTRNWLERRMGLPVRPMALVGGGVTASARRISGGQVKGGLTSDRTEEDSRRGQRA